ncbi:hypothetical protein [Pseudoteredinibacter isoporae]|uniref:Uncharacterized protein n=1 Tax=Pseudoteredinibacter isoporae TaxID=570281 RepID=A0A7X0MXX3_9GAMM|nr:hypothetical protein [Pseudoteredinibacter isoporae]MBB6522454.1 hypothetical protein [Pseudoteredinibacter isoporae]NHO87984.1 hypothetical protein [Pseudoteredinibacter isoporae]NIB23685.1 hypothetical protein [Pseudoteredinibacter isoporae]
MKQFTQGAVYILVFLLSLTATHLNAQDNKDRLVWDQQENVEQFWDRYIDSRGGLSWERSTDYPEYDKVKEGDTFMVELEQGPCLMEFFHSRWRRANDVWRWGEDMNNYGGCPYVFD